MTILLHYALADDEWRAESLGEKAAGATPQSALAKLILKLDGRHLEPFLRTEPQAA